jgi:hypothetical protein
MARHFSIILNKTMKAWMAGFIERLVFCESEIQTVR